jgi:hypothetical protein
MHDSKMNTLTQSDDRKKIAKANPKGQMWSTRQLYGRPIPVKELARIQKMEVQRLQTQDDILLLKIDFHRFFSNDKWLDEEVKQHLCAAEHKLTRTEKRIRKTQRALRIASSLPYTVW